MKSGFLFDLDGTLVDSLDDIAAALNHGLATCGRLPQPRELVRTFIGHGVVELVRQAVAPEPIPQGLLEATRAYYTAHVCDHGRLYEGIAPLIEALLERGHPLAVLTNKPHALALDVVERLFPAAPFVVVIGDREGHPKKPDPAGARWVAEQLGVAPSDCTLIGDSVVDVRTAKAAGMRSFAVTWGFCDRADLVESAPDAVFEDVAALTAMLLESRETSSPKLL